jgi:hypothetical protein
MRNEVGRGRGVAGITSVIEPRPRLIHVRQVQPLSLQFNLLSRPVGRSIVHEDYPEAIGANALRPETGQNAGDVFGFVVSTDDNVNGS